MISMTMVRCYMLALKGAGYLQLRLGDHEAALERLEKVAEFDSSDRFNVQALVEIARDAMQGHGAKVASAN